MNMCRNMDNHLSGGCLRSVLDIDDLSSNPRPDATKKSFSGKLLNSGADFIKDIEA